MSSTISPLAPTDVPEMPVVAGVTLATASAGIRYKGRTDVLLAILDEMLTGGLVTVERVRVVKYGADKRVTT